MARTAVLTKDQIIVATFDLINEKGIEAVTIRSIAKKLNKSTAPISTQYATIERLFNDLTHYVNQQLYKSMGQQRTPDSFLNIGLGILAFALDNKLIFTCFFLSKEQINFDFVHNEPYFLEQMEQELPLSLIGKKRMQSLLDDMWVYTYGLAAMICTGIKSNKHLSYYEEKLAQTGYKLINYHLYSSGKYETYVNKLHGKMPCHEVTY